MKFRNFEVMIFMTLIPKKMQFFFISLTGQTGKYQNSHPAGLLIFFLILFWIYRKDIDRCKVIYSRLIRMFTASLHRVVLSAILTFYRGGKMWEFEFVCTDLILDLLSVHSNIDQAIQYMFGKHEYKFTSKCKIIVHVFYKITM